MIWLLHSPGCHQGRGSYLGKHGVWRDRACKRILKPIGYPRNEPPPPQAQRQAAEWEPRAVRWRRCRKAWCPVTYSQAC